MKKIYLLPNLVTTAGLYCGFYAIVLAIEHKFEASAWAILAACIFDQLDGRIARLAHATSEFGVEYDSLSDLVSFGVAPAVLIYQGFVSGYGRLGWIVGFLFVTCAALRLARFNVRVDSVAKGIFQGLPVPIAACTLAGFVFFQSEVNLPVLASPVTTRITVAALMLLLSSLMVSTLPYPSFKDVNAYSRARFGIFVLGVLAIVLIALRPEVTIFLIGFAYCFYGPFAYVVRTINRAVKRRSLKHGGASRVR
jgi:CDP-diacylglycerol--serine O-phosphatidyltransferase